MTDKELRALAEDVLSTEKESAKWKAGIPDNEEQEALDHSVRLATAIRRFRDATRSPSTALSLLDRLEAAEKVCEVAGEFCQTCVYVQSQYVDSGHACLTNTDAVSKLRYFVDTYRKTRGSE